MTQNDPASLSIRNRLRFLAKDSVIYGGAAALSKAVALITFPLLARHFSVADYGLIDFFAFLAALIAIAFVFGQDSAIARFFYEYTDEASRRQIISQSLALQLGLMSVTLPVIWLFSNWLSRVSHASPESGELFRTILVQIPFIVLINFSQGILKWTFARTSFLLVSLGSIALNALLLIIGVLAFDLNVIGVLRIGVMVFAVFALFGLYTVRHWLVPPTDLRFLWKMLPYAIPYGVICSIAALVPLMERSLIAGLIGSYELGLYAAGAKVAMLVSIAISAFQTGWGPFSLAIHKQADASQTYNLVLKGFTIFVCVFVLLLSAAGEIIVNLLASQRFAGAAAVVFPLSMGLAIQATSWITGIGIGISKKSYLNLFGYAALLASTAMSIYLFAEGFGFVGVAYGVLVGQATLAAVSILLAQRAYPLPWAFRPVIATVLATLVIGLAGQWVSANDHPGGVSIVYLAGAMFILGFGWLINFSRQDRFKIVGYLKNA